MKLQFQKYFFLGFYVAISLWEPDNSESKKIVNITSWYSGEAKKKLEELSLGGVWMNDNSLFKNMTGSLV